MAQFTLPEVLLATGGTCTITEELHFWQVSTDTRTIQAGSLFVALEGTTFDGHHFIEKAKENGAIGAIVQKGRAVDNLPCIEVENTLKAYQDLASFHRNRFNIPIVAVTGSSGKTTTKEMVATVLETTYKVLKTEKNYNNEIGLPKTLLDLTEEHEACVLEMGMRGLGQIAELAAIAQPTIGIVTNVGTSHIELLGSQEAIGQAKAELIQALPPDGIAILNEDDEYVRAMLDMTEAKKITYGIDAEATVRGIQIQYKRDGIKFTCRCFDEIFDVFLPMIGIHNVSDCLAAVAVGRTLGVKPSAKMVKAFASFVGVPMRQEIVNCGDFIVLNDAYNANPDSMQESIKALAQLEAKRKVAIVGDMLELGDFSVEAHEQIGDILAAEGYGAVLTFGEQAKHVGKRAKEAGVPVVFSGNSHLEVANLYWDIREKNDVVLVKGSRGLKLERVVADLKERVE